MKYMTPKMAPKKINIAGTWINPTMVLATVTNPTRQVMTLSIT